jgi:hypothetical protein
MSLLISAVFVIGCRAIDGPDVRGDSATDRVALRDGAVVQGEIVEAPIRGPVNLVVRRDWAHRHVPEWAARWSAAEAPAVRRAMAQRRERLESWRRERSAFQGGPQDRINAWIASELARLSDNKSNASESPLIVVRLNRADVRSIERAPAGRTRLLRLAWVAGFPDPESMPTDDLKEALEGRGFDPSAASPVAIESLLATPIETDRTWLIRRAATELTIDPDLRFIRHGGLVLPEPASGQPVGVEGALAAVSALKELLGEDPGDPLAERLRSVAASGRVGAVVTKLDVASDLSAASVEISLWVHEASGRWAQAGSRTARVRPQDLGPAAGKDLEGDPQVAMIFRAVEAIGLGGIDGELKQRSLGIGAATQKALGLARSAATADLAALAFPLREPLKRGVPKRHSP